MSSTARGRLAYAPSSDGRGGHRGSRRSDRSARSQRRSARRSSASVPTPSATRTATSSSSRTTCCRGSRAARSRRRSVPAPARSSRGRCAHPGRPRRSRSTRSLPGQRDPALLTLAGLSGFTETLAFEAKCPNGVSRIPPHLDVLLERGDEIVAVESKCTEYLAREDGQGRRRLPRAGREGRRARALALVRGPDRGAELPAARRLPARQALPRPHPHLPGAAAHARLPLLGADERRLAAALREAPRRGRALRASSSPATTRCSFEALSYSSTGASWTGSRRSRPGSTRTWSSCGDATRSRSSGRPRHEPQGERASERGAPQRRDHALPRATLARPRLGRCMKNVVGGPAECCSWASISPGRGDGDQSGRRYRGSRHRRASGSIRDRRPGSRESQRRSSGSSSTRERETLLFIDAPLVVDNKRANASARSKSGNATAAGGSQRTRRTSTRPTSAE